MKTKIMLHFILQTSAFQLFFLIIYDVFLKRETFFNWNRFYLIATASLSIVLPFIKVESFKDVVPQDYIISLPEIVLGQTTSNIKNASRGWRNLLGWKPIVLPGGRGGEKQFRSVLAVVSQ